MENAAPQAAAPRETVGASTACLTDTAIDPVADDVVSQLPATVTDNQGTQVTITDTSRILALDLYGSLAATVYGLGLGEIEGWWGHTGESAGFEAAVFHQPRRNETVAILLNASNVPDVPSRLFRRIMRIIADGDEGSLAGTPICAE